MPSVPHARHIDWLPSGTFVSGAYTSGFVRHTSGNYPITVSLPAIFCFDQDASGTKWWERHIDYANIGIPQVAAGITCCDAIPLNYYEDYLWPFSGVGDPVVARVLNTHNCRSADGKPVYLYHVSGPNFQDHSGYWYGTKTLRGGVLQLRFMVVGSGTGGQPIPTFEIMYSGCGSGTQTKFADCTQPLRIAYPDKEMGACCDCALTSDSAAVQVSIEANCNPVVWARHVDYAPTGVPIVVQADDCGGAGEIIGCQSMTCPLTASITNITGCDCLVGIYTLDYGLSFSNEWGNNIIGGCSSTAKLDVRCEDYFDPVTHHHYLKLTARIVCGATNTGEGFVLIEPFELEDLDTTIIVPMTDPSISPCSNNCTWQWIAMSMQWIHIVFCADGFCNCVQPDTPGTSDGELRNTDCTQTVPPSCCIGEVAIHLMRV